MKVTARVFVEVSDAYLWTLHPFSYLFNKYWSSEQEVMVCGYNRQKFSLPSNFTFFQIDSENYPANRWTDGMLRWLRRVRDDHIVLLFCDYWLTRPVDVNGVQACIDFARMTPGTLRVDLSTDRMYAGGAKDIAYLGHYDIVETKSGTPYQMSFQAGVWSREKLIEMLPEGKTAWEAEIHIQPPASMRVFGTRQWPVRYANAMLKGKLDMKQLGRMFPDDWEIVKKMIPPEIETHE